MDIHFLPHVNALLNAGSSIFLAAGYCAIREGRTRLHRAAMISALVCSSLFLTSYVVYHANIGSMPYQGQGVLRSVYFSILISHTALAAAVPVLAGMTLVRALRRSFRAHKAIARWTLPIWFYVSVTGVIIYLMLYQFPVPTA